MTTKPGRRGGWPAPGKFDNAEGADAGQERSNYFAFLKVNPIVDSLRLDPRFANLVRRVGLPQ